MSAITSYRNVSAVDDVKMRFSARLKRVLKKQHFNFERATRLPPTAIVPEYGEYGTFLPVRLHHPRGLKERAISDVGNRGKNEVPGHDVCPPGSVLQLGQVNGHCPVSALNAGKAGPGAAGVHIEEDLSQVPSPRTILKVLNLGEDTLLPPVSPLQASLVEALKAMPDKAKAKAEFGGDLGLDCHPNPVKVKSAVAAKPVAAKPVAAKPVAAKSVAAKPVAFSKRKREDAPSGQPTASPVRLKSLKSSSDQPFSTAVHQTVDDCRPKNEKLSAGAKASNSMRPPLAPKKKPMPPPKGNSLEAADKDQATKRVVVEAMAEQIHAVPQPAPPNPVVDEWVQCERCEKWRVLPPDIKPNELPNRWFCSMNSWVPSELASCDVPEQETSRSVYLQLGLPWQDPASVGQGAVGNTFQTTENAPKAIQGSGVPVSDKGALPSKSVDSGKRGFKEPKRIKIKQDFSARDGKPVASTSSLSKEKSNVAGSGREERRGYLQSSANVSVPRNDDVQSSKFGAEASKARREAGEAGSAQESWSARNQLGEPAMKAVGPDLRAVRPLQDPSKKRRSAGDPSPSMTDSDTSSSDTSDLTPSSGDLDLGLKQGSKDKKQTHKAPLSRTSGSKLKEEADRPLPARGIKAKVMIAEAVPGGRGRGTSSSQNRAVKISSSHAKVKPQEMAPGGPGKELRAEEEKLPKEKLRRPVETPGRKEDCPEVAERGVVQRDEVSAGPSKSQPPKGDAGGRDVRRQDRPLAKREREADLESGKESGKRSKAGPVEGSKGPKQGSVRVGKEAVPAGGGERGRTKDGQVEEAQYPSSHGHGGSGEKEQSGSGAEGKAAVGVAAQGGASAGVKPTLLRQAKELKHEADKCPDGSKKVSLYMRSALKFLECSSDSASLFEYIGREFEKLQNHAGASIAWQLAAVAHTRNQPAGRSGRERAANVQGIIKSATSEVQAGGVGRSQEDKSSAGLGSSLFLGSQLRGSVVNVLKEATSLYLACDAWARAAQNTASAASSKALSEEAVTALRAVGSNGGMEPIEVILQGARKALCAVGLSSAAV